MATETKGMRIERVLMHLTNLAWSGTLVYLLCHESSLSKYAFDGMVLLCALNGIDAGFGQMPQRRPWTAAKGVLLLIALFVWRNHFSPVTTGVLAVILVVAWFFMLRQKPREDARPA